ncbi:MAG: FixH family protein [Alphaproteobacteria bacterium]|nr:FixH family protein [Alphaproteobacteria bacterium]
MRHLLVVVGVAALLGTGVACSGGADSRPMSSPAAPADRSDDQAGVYVRKTQNGEYVVEVRFDPPHPQIGDLFSAVATVRDRAGTPIDTARVKLNATMPAHGHGMMTDPILRPGTCDDAGVCVHPDGVYRADGFKFHMAGAWTVTVEVEGPRGPDSTSFVHEMK